MKIKCKSYYIEDIDHVPRWYNPEISDPQIMKNIMDPIMSSSACGNIVTMFVDVWTSLYTSCIKNSSNHYIFFYDRMLNEFLELYDMKFNFDFSCWVNKVVNVVVPATELVEMEWTPLHHPNK